MTSFSWVSGNNRRQLDHDQDKSFESFVFHSMIIENLIIYINFHFKFSTVLYFFLCFLLQTVKVSRLVWWKSLTWFSHFHFFKIIFICRKNKERRLKSQQQITIVWKTDWYMVKYILSSHHKHMRATELGKKARWVVHKWRPSCPAQYLHTKIIINVSYSSIPSLS